MTKDQAKQVLDMLTDGLNESDTDLIEQAITLMQAAHGIKGATE